MSKLILINENTIEAIEDIKKGETFNLNSLINDSKDLSPFKENINKIILLKEKEFKTELKNEYEEEFNKYKELAIKSAVNQIAYNKDKEINNLNKIIETNNIQKELDIERAKEKISLSKNEEISKLNETIATNNSETELAIKRAENKITSDKNEQINDLNKIIAKSDSENKLAIKDAEEKISSDKDKQISNLNETIARNASEKELAIERAEKIISSQSDQVINDLKEEYKKLEDRKIKMNIKEVGEDLENYIINEWDKVSSGFENSTLEKQNKVIDGTKADFIFKHKTEIGAELLSLTIEAKSEAILTDKNKKKNDDHYKKLNSDSEKNKTKYSLLISELEKENDFLFKKVQGYENMYVVRPYYFINFLSLIIAISKKQEEIVNSSFEFKTKNDILNDFNDMKDDEFAKSIKNIQNGIDSIIKSSKKIENEAHSINDKATKILGRRNLETLEAKINNFKITSILSRIDKLENS